MSLEEYSESLTDPCTGNSARSVGSTSLFARGTHSIRAQFSTSSERTSREAKQRHWAQQEWPTSKMRVENVLKISAHDLKNSAREVKTLAAKKKRANAPNWGAK